MKVSLCLVYCDMLDRHGRIVVQSRYNGIMLLSSVLHVLLLVDSVLHHDVVYRVDVSCFLSRAKHVSDVINTLNVLEY